MREYLVEFIGTMFLVFVILATNNYIAIGLALAIAVMLGGGAYNPAVSLALFSAGKMSKLDLMPYIIAQIGGGLAGAHLANII
jgi:aquaporin Z